MVREKACFRICLILSVTVALWSCSKQKSIQEVVAIDGDTLLVKEADGNSYKVNLAYIDAPEREQPFGREAKGALNELLRDYKGAFEPNVQKMMLEYNGVNINLELVSRGAAWVDTRIDDPLIAAKFMEAQQQAKLHLRGVWGLEHGLRVPPWVWRQQGTERMKKPPVRYERSRPSTKPPKSLAKPDKPKNKRPENADNL